MEQQNALADHFDLIADLTEVDGGGPHRAAVFRRCAERLRAAGGPVAIERMERWFGVGPSCIEIARHFQERGSSDRLDGLLSRYPASVLELKRVRGIGPRTCARLYSEMGISSFAQLVEMAEASALDPALARETLVARDLRAGRLPWNAAALAAARETKLVEREVEVDRALACGSVRRRKETVGDVDIVALVPDAAEISSVIDEFCAGRETLARGENRASVRTRLASGHLLQVDLWCVSSCFGAAILYATGSRETNEKMRARAKKMGMTLNEYGLWRDGALVAGESEESVFEALETPFLAPEER